MPQCVHLFKTKLFFPNLIISDPVISLLLFSIYIAIFNVQNV